MRLLQRDHDGGVVGGSFLRARALVDLTLLQARCERGRQQEVIDADTAVVLEGLAEVVPEGELACLAGVQRAKGVDVAEVEQGR